MGLYGLLGGGGGKYVFIYKACGKLRGSRDMLSQETLILDLLIDTGTPYEQAPYQQCECKYVDLDRHQTIAFSTTSQRRQGLYALHRRIRYSCIYGACRTIACQSQ